MAKIKLKSTSLSSDPEVKAPRFYFMPYSKGMTVTNNEEEIDFVTDGKSLYVCAVENAVLNGDDIDKNTSYLLKIVSQGEKGERGTPGIDGAAGVVPEIGAEYIDIGDEKKLALTIGGKRKAMTGDLTPPVYVPTLVNDRYLTWEWNGDEPATIDLMKLRPVNERPILLRTNSDNTKLDAEVSGPANFIQWKYEGDEHWTNLISIQELMNLAFAGMCTWEAADGKWHFGYKEVVKATYDSTKSGRRIISRVELGQILFDAGEIPLQDYGVEIEMIEAQLEELKNSVQSISINNGRKFTPDRDGNVDLDLSGYVKKSEIPENVDLDGYATETWVNSQGFLKNIPDTYAKKSDIPTDYVKSVKLNGTTHTPANGVVDLGSISGGSADTSDCVKSVTINNETKTPVNGNVSFNIEVGNLTSFDVKIENNTLYKKNNNDDWIACGSVTESEVLTESEVKHWIGQILEGVLNEAIPEYVRTSGHNYFVRINELNSILSGYATKEWVLEQLVGSEDPDNPITIHSYRTFTIYKWYAVDATPATPTLPTSASWDGTTNGLTLTGNTLNWSDHPGNNPGDTTRLWMAQITLLSDGTVSNDWSGPFDIYGDGEPGKDGNGIEFIYTLCTNESEYKSLTTPNAQHDDNRDDDYPEHWTDQPQGIGEYSASDNISTFHNFSGNEKVLFKIEAASMRAYNGATETWGPYCKPFIWSMWGEDGIDGDGLEYIFFLAEESDVIESNGIYSLKSENLPDDDWAYEYQAPDSGWSDDPQTPSLNNPYVFVSKRKYHVDRETKLGEWSNWSEPALWSTYKVGPQGPTGASGDGTIVDLTNEMDIVSVSEATYRCNNQYDFNTLFAMYNNSNPIDNITVTVKNSNGEYVNSTSFLTNGLSDLGGGISVAISTDVTTNKPKATITVLEDTNFTNYLNGFNIEFKVVKDTTERFVTYKIVPIPMKETMRWEIIPNSDVVIQNFDGNLNAIYTPEYLTCSVRSQSGNNEPVELTSSDFGNSKGQYRLTYSIYNANGTIIGSAATYIIGSTQIDVRNINYAKVVFELEYKYDDEFILIDRETVPIIRNGRDAVKGAAVRGPVEWTATARRWCAGKDSDPVNAQYHDEDISWIDIVFYDGHYYRCINSYTGATGDTWDYENNNVSVNWELADEFAFVATDVLVANSGAINVLKSGSLLLKDTNDNVVGGAKGTDLENGTIFWAGGTYNNGNISNAPFVVTKQGQLTASNADITGTINSSNGNIGPLTIDNDNLSASYHETISTTTDNSYDAGITLTANSFEVTGGYGPSTHRDEGTFSVAGGRGRQGFVEITGTTNSGGGFNNLLYVDGTAKFAGALIANTFYTKSAVRLVFDEDFTAYDNTAYNIPGTNSGIHYVVIGGGSQDPGWDIASTGGGSGIFLPDFTSSDTDKIGFCIDITVFPSLLTLLLPSSNAIVKYYNDGMKTLTYDNELTMSAGITRRLIFTIINNQATWLMMHMS